MPSLCPALALTALLALPAMASPAPPLTPASTPDGGPWIPVIKHVPDGVEVVARLVPTERGAQLEFVNRGTQAIHFEFYFRGSQQAKDSEKNRRIHLRPGKSSGAVEFKVPDHGAQGLPAALDFRLIRLGSDTGSFWRD